MVFQWVRKQKGKERKLPPRMDLPSTFRVGTKRESRCSDWEGEEVGRGGDFLWSVVSL
jgi:hypothetical protein